MNLPPIFGVGLAILLLGERLASFHLVGAVLVASGVFLATRRGAEASPTVGEAEPKAAEAEPISR